MRPQQLMLPGCTLEDMEAEAISFIRQHEPQEGYYVGFSGGKDSIVTLDLVKRSGVKYEAWHSLTSIDPPEVVGFVRREYPDVKIAKPKKSVYELIFDHAPPKRLARWCCDKLKKRAYRGYTAVSPHHGHTRRRISKACGQGKDQLIQSRQTATDHIQAHLRLARMGNMGIHRKAQPPIPRFIR